MMFDMTRRENEAPMGETQPIHLESERKERELLGVIEEIQGKFLDELESHFGTWRVCGDGSHAFAHILGHKLDLPIGQNIEKDHIEIAIGTFSPDDKTRTEEETYVKVFIGDSVFFIDPIYGLLYWKDPPREVLVKKYPKSEFKERLTEDWHIKDFDPEDPHIQKALDVSGALKAQRIYDYSIKYLNSPKLESPPRKRH